MEDAWKPLHTFPLDSVGRDQVAAELNTVADRGPTAANRARASLSAFFGCFGLRTWIEHRDANRFDRGRR